MSLRSYTYGSSGISSDEPQKHIDKKKKTAELIVY